jgi:predicted phosphodiesterase
MALRGILRSSSLIAPLATLVFFGYTETEPLKEVGQLTAPMELNELEIFLNAVDCLDAISSRSESSALHKFQVVGHAYGSRTGNNKGLDPRVIIELESHESDWVIFTGDIVREATTENLRLVRNQFRAIRKVAVTPGNHDGSPKKFEKLIGPRYSAQLVGDNLLIFLDSNSFLRNKEEDQINFLKKFEGGEFSNILIFMHHLLWATTSEELISSNAVQINESFNRVRELVQSIAIGRIFYLSGDVGAFPQKSGLTCRQEKSEVFISSGLGRSDTSNILSFEIYDDGAVWIEPKMLAKFEG